MTDTGCLKIEAHGNQQSELIPILVSISKSTRALTGLKLAEVGFHNGQDELLFVLDEKNPSSVTQIADEITVRPSTVSKMLDRLTRSGLVERVGDRDDARRTMVRITKDGVKARNELVAVRKSLEAELLSSHPETDLMLKTLQAVAEILRTRLGRLR